MSDDLDNEKLHKSYNEALNLERHVQELNIDFLLLNNKVDKLEQRLENIILSEADIKRRSNKPKKSKKKLLWVGEILFYGLLIFLVLGAFLVKTNSDGRPTSFAGYSTFTVLSSSMESVIPKGSLVITKNVLPESLKIGDDITYMANDTTTVTHRIITIVENHLNTGQRAFETKGVMNNKPDKNLVPASNVVGKVIYSSEFLGKMATFISKNWPFMIFVIVVIVFLGGFLRKVLSQEKSDDYKTTKKRKFKFKRKEIKDE